MDGVRLDAGGRIVGYIIEEDGKPVDVPASQMLLLRDPCARRHICEDCRIDVETAVFHKLVIDHLAAGHEAPLILADRNVL